MELPKALVGFHVHNQEGLCPFNYSCDFGRRNPSKEFKRIFPAWRPGGTGSLNLSEKTATESGVWRKTPIASSHAFLSSNVVGRHGVGARAVPVRSAHEDARDLGLADVSFLGSLLRPVTLPSENAGRLPSNLFATCAGKAALRRGRRRRPRAFPTAGKAASGAMSF